MRSAQIAIGLALALSLALACSSQAQAANNIIGGEEVGGNRAPWAVLIVETKGDGSTYSCSGSLIGLRRVLTAAHCATGNVANMKVYAGARIYDGGLGDPATKFDQQRGVGEKRLHPMWQGSREVAAPSDLATLTLGTAFDPATSDKIAAIDIGTTRPTEGTPLTAYGLGTPQVGHLKRLGLTPLPRFDCETGATAVYFCASTADGATCPGDSGSGLVVGNPPTLVAVTTGGGVRGDGEQCFRGNVGYYSDLTAPELRTWIAGNDAPPRSPRPGAAGASAQTTNFPDGNLRCNPGDWSDGPSFTFTFITGDGRVVQSGPSNAYLPQPADAGQGIECRIAIGNAGGTAERRITGMRVPAALGLTASGTSVGVAQYPAGAPGRVTATAPDGAALLDRRISSTADFPVSLAGLPVGAYNTCAEQYAQSGVTAFRECVPIVVNGTARTLVRAISVRASKRKLILRYSAGGPAIGVKAKVRFTQRKSKKAKSRKLGKTRTITLKPTTTIKSPKVPRHRRVYVKLSLPPIPSQGATYNAATLSRYVGRRR